MLSATEACEIVKVPPGSLGRGAEFDLPAGRYVLTEVNHPVWVCRNSIG